MEKRTVEQMFMEEYGYIGSQDELDWFISKYGGDPYLSYEQYRSSVNADRYGSSGSNNGDAGDVKDEFNALFKEIIGKAKKEEMPENRNELVSEFTFMAILFLLKASIFFALRFGQERGFCCNL
jgi:ABC-type transport system substrate-binding protein